MSEKFAYCFPQSACIVLNSQPAMYRRSNFFMPCQHQLYCLQRSFNGYNNLGSERTRGTELPVHSLTCVSSLDMVKTSPVLKSGLCFFISWSINSNFPVYFQISNSSLRSTIVTISYLKCLGDTVPLSTSLQI